MPRLTCLIVQAARRVRRPLAASLLAAAAVLALTGCATRHHVTLTIHADGSVVVETELTAPEDQVRSWVAMSEQHFDHDPGSPHGEGWERLTPEGPAPIEPDDGAANDDDASERPVAGGDDPPLAERVAAMIEGRGVLGGGGAAEGVETDAPEVVVADGEVTIRTRSRFADLGAFVRSTSQNEMIMNNRSISLSSDDEGRLVIAFGRPEWLEHTGPDGVAMVRSQVVSSVRGFSFRVVTPGPVVSSPWPIDGNATELAGETDDEAAVDAVVSAMVERVEIVAEPAGLDLASLPLSSVDFAWAGGEGEAFDFGVELTDARENDYYAEATQVTLTRARAFPAAERFPELVQAVSAYPEPGAQVQGRLYAPEGRNVLRLAGLRVVAAEDDQGRAIASAEHGAHAGEPDLAEPGPSLAFHVRLEPPPADAIAIDVLRLEGELTTFDRLATEEVTPVVEDPGRAIPIDALVPGATATFHRVERQLTREDQFAQLQARVEVELRGPPAIRGLFIDFAAAGFDSASGHEMHRESETDDDGERVERRLYHLHGFQHHQGSPRENTGDLVLVLKRPEGVRRERLTVELDPIDLY